MLAKYRKVTSVVAVLVLVVLTGRTTARGGGHIPSVSGVEGEKATFGFQFQCNDKKDWVHGQMEYHDHGADVAFHGTLPKIPVAAIFGPEFGVVSCDDPIFAELVAFLVGEITDFELPPGFTAWAAEYRPQIEGVEVDCSTSSDCGVILILPTTEETPPILCDGFIIQLEGGLYDGYENGGCLNGGNITFF
jgi:hypothetical protein